MSVITRASAPGKLLIAGEFAVLEGAPALVMAIHRRAHASLNRQVSCSTSSPTALRTAITEQLGLSAAESDRLVLDSSELFHGGEKLGLGSSAALCVAATALLRDVETNAVFHTALTIHRRFQSGLGSGFDIAASTYGGVLLYRQDTAPTAITLPQDLYWQVFASHVPAITTTAIRQWGGVRDKAALFKAACAVAESVDGGASRLIHAIADFQSCLRAINDAHGLSVVCPNQCALDIEAAHIARRFNCVLIHKQSGAGGGDVSIALADDRRALQAFERIAVQSGLKPLNLEIDMNGVRRD